MGIEGIDILKGGNMENERQSQPAPGQQQDESASPPPEQNTPPSSTPDQDPASVGQAQTEDSPSEGVSQEASDDVAPDADEPGDSELPEELAEHVHEGETPQDNVDQEG